MSFNAGVPEEVGILDLLNVFSLWAQIDNMNMDSEQTKYVRKVIQAISDEIKKLHEENNIIMKQNDIIAKMIFSSNINIDKEKIYNLYKEYIEINNKETLKLP